jgi:quaternary ammonium compound-resistance protein SugE
MAWLFILMADVFKVAWPFALKWSVTFSRWSPLAESVKQLPAAAVYSAFIGIDVRLHS